MSKEFSTQITCHCERSNPIFKVGIASFLAMTRSVCVVLILMSADLAAQTSTHDSIYNSLHGRISLGGGFDSRNSFISNRRAHIWGIKVAAEFGELIQLGIGYNRRSSPVAESDSPVVFVK